MDHLLTVLSQNPGVFYTGVLVLGLIIGSFLNVVILRLPKMMEQEWRAQCAELMNPATGDAGSEPLGCAVDSNPPSAEPRLTLSHPNSTCPHCGHAIKPWENIPVISYVFLGGKCSACKTPISLRYPIIELATGLLSLTVALYFGVSAFTFAALLFTWLLIAMSAIDFDTQLLPDSLTLPLLWLGLIVNTLLGHVPLEDAVWGAVAGYLSLWTVYQVFRILTGKEGMGFGDFKLLAALGAWMGWQMLPLIILLSSMVGAVVGIALIVVRGRDRNIPIPFGPYLAAAGWIALLWGNQIVTFYLERFATPTAVPAY
ncbi:MAG: prepilin peptidase [Hahellaceae bacterium]|nr:prepilin peptidase [Hahellaceae bacterium]